MYSKFTLALEKEILQKAEAYAKGENRSLSDIVSEYITLLAKEGDDSEVEFSSLIQSLKGSFKMPKESDYKQELEKELVKKYL